MLEFFKKTGVISSIVIGLIFIAAILYFEKDLKDSATIIAIILGPIIALRLESYVRENKQKTDVKKYVFRNLLATRRYPDTILPEHYRAINTIYMDFHGSEKIIAASKKYISHLNNAKKREGDELNQWIEVQKTLLVELLNEMAKDLKYSDITHSDLALDAYVPGAAITQLENSAREAECQKAVLKLMKGEITIPISINNEVNRVVNSSLIDSKSLISEKVN
jgi:hypothetical protein